MRLGRGKRRTVVRLGTQHEESSGIPGLDVDGSVLLGIDKNDVSTLVLGEDDRAVSDGVGAVTEAVTRPPANLKNVSRTTTGSTTRQ
jgi:hypothetical protein